MAQPIKVNYAEDGLYTAQNIESLVAGKFQQAYQLGMSTIRHMRPDLEIRWRVYTACWAAQHAMRLPGDFVECGVFTGILARAIIDYVNFDSSPERTFWLLDTFAGFPVEQLNQVELASGMASRGKKYVGTLEQVSETFAPFANVKIVPGKVPDTLPQVTSERIAYLSIDMNAAYPEVAAIEYFWPKMVPGGIVVFDDYNFMAHVPQKHALDAWAAGAGVEIMAMPTGQGLLIKT